MLYAVAECEAADSNHLLHTRIIVVQVRGSCESVTLLRAARAAEIAAFTADRPGTPRIVPREHIPSAIAVLQDESEHQSTADK